MFRATKKLPVAFLIILFAGIGGLHAQTNLAMRFINNTGYADTDVFVTFQNAVSVPFAASYAGGTPVTFLNVSNVMSQSYSLQQIGAAGFQITNANSVGVFVSYGSPLTNTTAAPSFFPNSPGAAQRFQNFEITRITNAGGSPNLGGQGNLTAINYFTAPMTIRSYTGTNTGANYLQQRGFNPGETAQSIGAGLAAASGNNTNAIIRDSNGEILRFIGPSTFGSGTPYNSYSDYLQALHTSGQVTSIRNANAFVAGVGTNTTNFNFQLNFSATVSSNNTITMAGNISTVLTPNGGTNTPGPTFTNATVTLSGANQATLDQIIYGQTVANFTNSVTYGSGWTDFENYVATNGLGAQPVFTTTQALSIGEITSGLLMGFLGSTNTVSQYGATPLSDLFSDQWWQLDPMVAFSGVQTNSDFFSEYSSVLYNASSNQVYSIPYSDRMGDGPLMQTVQFIGTNGAVTVDTWVVELGAPIPEARAALYLTATFVVFGAFMAWRKRRARPALRS